MSSFTIDIPDDELDDLRRRIRATRWPAPAPGEPWSQGTDVDYLRELMADWQRFDWRSREAELNRYSHFKQEIDGTDIHFVHKRAVGGAGVPLILTHGWPSSFLEYLPAMSLLADFDVVVPSLPGYGFSARPQQALNYRDVARMWHALMTGLGYQRYGAGGGDFGAGVASLLALDYPDAVIGLHLTNLELSPVLADDSAPLTAAEQEYLAAKKRWLAVEHAYSDIQATKPQTVSYGLTDSPVGLAAWLVEKWRSWTDSGGSPDRAGREFLLTMLTIYWATRCIATSMRDYYDNRWSPVRLDAGARIEVPTAVCRFTHNFVPEGEPPREWAERLYNVTRWTSMPRGGHFAPIEEPELYATDVREFFASLVSA